MIKGIGHSAFYVSNMERSLDYYVTRLGFIHAFSLKSDGGEPWIEYLRIPGTEQFIELFYASGKGPVEGTYYAHLCLVVDDAQATLRELEGRGAPITSPITKGKSGNMQFWSADPDGNRIEFMQIMPDSMHAKAVKE